MDDFLTNFKKDLGEIVKQLKINVARMMGKKVAPDGSMVTAESDSVYEINLVPEVKAQMIKAQKVRNLVLFICIVVSAVMGGVVLVLFGIKGGQDIAMHNQDVKLERLSDKLQGYEELADLVTIQQQLSKYSALQGNKTMLSRVFGALGVMVQQGKDVVKLSDLQVNLDTNLVSMEGQADAKVAPLIDYRVLESFKKSVSMIKYDYGRYVDVDGYNIPAQCIIEADDEGNAFRTGDSYYAWWDIAIEGCEGSPRGSSGLTQSTPYHYSADAEVELGVPGHTTVIETVCDENGENCHDEIRITDLPTQVQPTEPVEGEELTEEDLPERAEEEEKEDEEKEKEEEDLTPRPVKVKIWRTPKFDDWYKGKQMALTGAITGIEHFESKCYQYKGTEVGKTVKWTSLNECLLAPDGLTITGSSNGRDESDNLVLRFSARATFVEDFFAAKNMHMIAIGPMGQNVTDSFMQIGGMFTKEARECDEDDVECLSGNNAGGATGGGNNGSNGSNGGSGSSGRANE